MQYSFEKWASDIFYAVTGNTVSVALTGLREGIKAS
jgi:hypothetical protein